MECGEWGRKGPEVEWGRKACRKYVCRCVRREREGEREHIGKV